MACRHDPTAEIPKADLLEQQTPAQPETLDDDPTAMITPAAADDIADAVNEADLLEQLAPQTPPQLDEDDYPHGPPTSERVMADPLVEVAVRVYTDFAERHTLADVLTVVASCRNDLDTATAAALPELVDRLARQRLTDHVAPAEPSQQQ